jgi:hypothetical protein
MKRSLKKRLIAGMRRSGSGQCFALYFVFMAALQLAGVDRLHANQAPVAVGDGFVLTQEDVNNLSAYAMSQNFGSTEVQHRQAALRIKLFSMEAVALGLTAKGSEGKEDTVPGMLALAEKYMDKLMGDYPLSESAVKSYYLAHPEKFSRQTTTLAEDKFLPLDDGLKEKIKLKIMMAKRKTLADQAFEDLKEKYHVRIPGKGTGK